VPSASGWFTIPPDGTPQLESFLRQVHRPPRLRGQLWLAAADKGYVLKPGDIAGGMGKSSAPIWAGVESWLNQRACVFAPKPGYAAAFVRNSIIAPLAQVEATETATTVIHIGKNDIDHFTVIIPDAPVVQPAMPAVV
jgi:type I restriction enzyme S subunit